MNTEPVPLRRLTSHDEPGQRAVRRGSLIRLTRGIAVDATDWAGADIETRRHIRLEATLAALHEHRPLSHRSAGIVWGLPDTSPDDHRVHVTDSGLVRTHSGNRAVRHAAPLTPDDIVELDGRPVTSLPRTVLDIARSTSFEHAVVVFDHVLHHGLLTRDEIAASLADWPSARGIVRARRALDFADADAESPGESVSRVVIDRDGLPAPVLQRWFDTDRGRFRVDFWWPDFGVIGEFDGMVKYGADPRSIVDEKLREDALRRLTIVRGCARWTWSDARRTGVLQRVLRTAGLPVGW
jgi:hypothetical protein